MGGHGFPYPYCCCFLHDHTWVVMASPILIIVVFCLIPQGLPYLCCCCFAQNHTWTVTASLNHQDVYQGQLLGTKAVTFDALTGTAEFTNLRLTHSGVCPVTFVVTSDPPEYVISGVVEVPLMTPMQRDLVVEERSVLEVSLPLTYDTTTAPFFTVLIRNHYSSRDDIRVVSHTHRAGEQHQVVLCHVSAWFVKKQHGSTSPFLLPETFLVVVSVFCM